MAQEIINYGNTANDGTGDPLRDAFIKVDDNFTQIWAAGPVGSNITVLNNTISVVDTNGNLILSPNGIGVIQTNSKVLPRLDNTYDLGTANLRYRSMFVGAGGITNNGNLILNTIANLRIPGGLNGYVIQTDGSSNLSWVAMPGAGNGSPGGANLQVQYNANGLFGGSPNFTFDPTTSNLAVGNTTVGNISTQTVYANILSVDTAGNTWRIDNQTLRAPTGATWRSDTGNLDEYISSSVDGYLNFQTFDVNTNLATELHLEHGLVHVNILNGVNYQWEFNDTGLFSAPGNVTANGNITANYFLGDGSQLSNLPGGVIQGDIPPVNPNDTTLWWDDVTGRLYVWYDDGSGLQWVDAAPAGPAVTYGNANVASFLASGTNSANIVTTGNISASNILGNISGSFTAPGANGQVMFNRDGVIGASSYDFNFDESTLTLYVKVGSFSGEANGINALYAGAPGFTFLGSDVMAQFTGNVNSYSQINFQNVNPGELASGDYILTADNGTDSTYYLDIGIASSNHDDPDFFGDTSTVNDAYMYVTGVDQAGPSSAAGPGNLILGSTNGAIKMFVGNTAQANVVATVSSAGMLLIGNITADTFVTTPVPLANLTAVAGARAFVSDGNLAAAGNFGAQIGNAGSNVVPVYSDGTNWYVG